jgi:hypothetical protein
MRDDSDKKHLAELFSSIVLLGLSLKRPKPNDNVINDQNPAPKNAEKKTENGIPAKLPQTEEKSWNPEESRHRRIERGYWRLSGCFSAITTIAAIVAASFAGFALKASWDALTEPVPAVEP